jgi:hypothetical protein
VAALAGGAAPETVAPGAEVPVAESGLPNSTTMAKTATAAITHAISTATAISILRS